MEVELKAFSEEIRRYLDSLNNNIEFLRTDLKQFSSTIEKVSRSVDINFVHLTNTDKEQEELKKLTEEHEKKLSQVSGGWKTVLFGTTFGAGLMKVLELLGVHFGK